MNEYRIQDLSVGMKESFSIVITESMAEKFFEITGDKNPLHSDPEFAGKKGFPDKIVYGMLTASFISTFGGEYLPGRNCLIQGLEVSFPKPVMIGDHLTVCGEIIKLYEELKCVVIKITIRNQRGEKVLRGKLKAGVLDD
ncbi:dehydratase [Lachnospiraceae bacterium]|jgi:3-hydroxybutyryl-CoA dehydratase|nr:MaoC family dehydratase [uncultured Schaedlerella sp.]NBI60441.1 dehydratase [Lachnospiraceae bacterium]